MRGHASLYNKINIKTIKIEIHSEFHLFTVHCYVRHPSCVDLRAVNYFTDHDGRMVDIFY